MKIRPSLTYDFYPFFGSRLMPLFTLAGFRGICVLWTHSFISLLRILPSTTCYIYKAHNFAYID
jgi:hypothetical protein